jgi:surfeit locus 1 family protein
VDTQGFRPTEAPKGVLADVVLGWSKRPDPVTWAGGQVRGMIVPGEFAHHVVADPALAGLAANARPIRVICPTTICPMRCSGSFRADRSGDLWGGGEEEGVGGREEEGE